MTEEGDIGFSAYYVERNGEKVDLMTNERIQSHLMMEEGEILCIRPVLCKLNRFPYFFLNFQLIVLTKILTKIVWTFCCADVLEFDNSYSYLRSKKVWYNVVVDLPA